MKSLKLIFLVCQKTQGERYENESNRLEKNLRLISMDEGAENSMIVDTSIELTHIKII